MGGLLIYYYLSIYWLLNLYYGTGGLKFMEGLTGAAPKIIYGDAPAWTLHWSLFFWGEQSNFIFHGLYALALFTSLGMMLGQYTRVCSVVVFFCTVSFQTPAWWGTNSADQLVKIMSFLFMVSSLAGYASRSYSMDAKKNKSIGRKCQRPILDAGLALPAFSGSVMYDLFHFRFTKSRQCRLAKVAAPWNWFSHRPILGCALIRG